jgi:hypothetical protein
VKSKVVRVLIRKVCCGADFQGIRCKREVQCECSGGAFDTRKMLVM